MFSLLPDLLPRDSHALWYTSSRNPSSSASHDPHQLPPTDNAHPHANQRRNAHVIERSPLARLRNDEQSAERRVHNVASFGCGWLKPPGIPKTLHQLREERREQEEHQEAMRREQLAQELAEAEATGGTDAGLEGPSGLGPDAVMRDVVGSDTMDEVQLDGTRDLDDDIPEAEENYLSGVDESEDESSSDSSEDEPEPVGTPAGAARTARLQRELMTQMMRRPHDQFEESIVGEEEIDEEDQQEMIEEGDTIADGGDDLGMEVDLDDDIPEGDSAAVYEHTDTEEELSSSDDDQGEVSFAAARAPQSVRYRHSMARSEATRNSLAFSELLSADESSVIGSSPHVQRRV
ncbi:Apc15p protein-domain-containing protein [Pestalotiopsis sp. NC0098]|nr:Apc15p protein-domain-containing protein [Pestalotiopsis sp. NC0098]